MTVSLQKGEIWTQKQTHARKEGNVKRHKENGLSTSQGEGPELDFSLTDLKINQPYRHLDFGLLSYMCVR